MTSPCAACRVPIALLLAVVSVSGGSAQTPPERLRQAIDRLGDFDYTVRMEASRTVRRLPTGVNASGSVGGWGPRDAIRTQRTRRWGTA